MADVGAVGQGAASGAMTGAALGPWGAFAGGLIGGGMAFALGSDANAAKKRAADEALKRFDLSSTTQLAHGAAEEAASGVVPGASSMSKYLADMSQEFRRQHQSAADDADKALALGNMANTFNLASTVGGSLFRFGANTGWGQSKPQVGLGG